MRRRDFIGAVVAAMLPLAVRAQQSERVRQIAMLSEFSEAQMQPLVVAFRDQLPEYLVCRLWFVHVRHDAELMKQVGVAAVRGTK